MLPKTLVLLLLGVTYATAYLTSADHAALVRLAKDQLTKVVTASHNGHVGEFTDPHADLDTVVQASQSLEMLGEAYSS